MNHVGLGAMPSARLIGSGSYLPAKRLSNADMVSQLAQLGVETSDEWIVERTGIRFRHFADENQNTSDLAAEAGRRALADAGLQPSQIDLLIVATSTPDMVFPSTACIVQSKLGIAGGAAFDIQAVCSGFVYALSVAQAMIRSGAAKNALVIGAETFSRLLDFTDRGTCVLFGDGAGAVVVQAGDAGMPGGILATQLHADGQHTDMLCVQGQIRHGAVHGHALLTMDGQAVFKMAVSVLEQVAREVLAQAGLEPTSIDWLVPHQANIRIMQSTARKLRLPMEKVVVTVDQHGNTSAASIPLALDTARKDGRIQPGHTLLLEGVGGGFTWGACLLTWG